MRPRRSPDCSRRRRGGAAQPFHCRRARLEQAEMRPTALFGHHFGEPTAELDLARGAHDGQPHPVVPQLLEDRARLPRAEVEELRGEVLRIEERQAGVGRPARLDDTGGIVDGGHERLAGCPSTNRMASSSTTESCIIHPARPDARAGRPVRLISITEACWRRGPPGGRAGPGPEDSRRRLRDPSRRRIGCTVCSRSRPRIPQRTSRSEQDRGAAPAPWRPARSPRALRCRDRRAT